MQHILKIGILAALTLGAAAARAADPVVSARFSADSVMIGDQFSLDIRVDKGWTISPSAATPLSSTRAQTPIRSMLSA